MPWDIIGVLSTNTTKALSPSINRPRILSRQGKDHRPTIERQVGYDLGSIFLRINVYERWGGTGLSMQCLKIFMSHTFTTWIFGLATGACSHWLGSNKPCRNGRSLQPSPETWGTITDLSPSRRFISSSIFRSQHVRWRKRESLPNRGNEATISRCMPRVTSGWVESSTLREPEFDVLKARTLTIDESQNWSDINSLENSNRRLFFYRL